MSGPAWASGSPRRRRQHGEQKRHVSVHGPPGARRPRAHHPPRYVPRDANTPASVALCAPRSPPQSLRTPARHSPAREAPDDRRRVLGRLKTRSRVGWRGGVPHHAGHVHHRRDTMCGATARTVWACTSKAWRTDPAGAAAPSAGRFLPALRCSPPAEYPPLGLRYFSFMHVLPTENKYSTSQ
jgi:hypothetical protein